MSSPHQLLHQRQRGIDVTMRRYGNEGEMKAHDPSVSRRGAYRTVHLTVAIAADRGQAPALGNGVVPQQAAYAVTLLQRPFEIARLDIGFTRHDMVTIAITLPGDGLPTIANPGLRHPGLPRGRHGHIHICDKGATPDQERLPC
ncbi:MAG: hypothetical protein JO287_12960 [Pseudonocardiales bacterium]|nr:hypothetical protein [Pseudonocardiales bacterium]